MPTERVDRVRRRAVEWLADHAAPRLEVGGRHDFGRMELARSRLSGNTVTGRRSSVLTASALLNLGDISLRDVTIEGNSSLAEPNDTSTARAVVNVGNGSLEGERVTLVDNWPEEANSLPTSDPDAIN